MAMARPAARPRRSRRWAALVGANHAGVTVAELALADAVQRLTQRARGRAERRGPSAFAVGLVGGATVGGVIEASHLPRLEGPAFDAIRGRVPNGSSAVVVIATATCTQCPRRSPAPPRPSTATARAGGGRRAAIRARRCAAKHDVAAARPGTRARSRPLERTIAHALAVDPRVDDDTIAVECFAGGHVVLPGSAAVFRA